MNHRKRNRIRKNKLKHPKLVPASQSLSVSMKAKGLTGRTIGKDYFYLPIEFESLPWESYTKGDIQKLKDFLNHVIAQECSTS